MWMRVGLEVELTMRVRNHPFSILYICRMTPPFLAMVKKDHCFSNIEKGNLAGIEQLGMWV